VTISQHQYFIPWDCFIRLNLLPNLHSYNTHLAFKDQDTKHILKWIHNIAPYRGVVLNWTSMGYLHLSTV
jgi:hypothetical protein